MRPPSLSGTSLLEAGAAVVCVGMWHLVLAPDDSEVHAFTRLIFG